MPCIERLAEARISRPRTDMREMHEATGDRRPRGIRAAAIALAGAAIFALAMQPTHGAAQDEWLDEIDEWLDEPAYEEPGAGWLDGRAQALLEAAAKTVCQNECGSGQHCFAECFEEQYELYVWELDDASRIERRQTLDMLAEELRPDLMSPAHRERVALQEKRQRCRAEREARIDSCYEALPERGSPLGPRLWECEDIYRSEQMPCLQMETAESSEYKSCMSAARARKNSCYTERKQIEENYGAAYHREWKKCDALRRQPNQC